MATIYRELYPTEGQWVGAAVPQLFRNFGTNQPVTWLAFDSTTTEYAYWELGAVDYGGGAVSVDIVWGADTATSGAVRWEAAIDAVSPEADALNVETTSFGTPVTVDDSHLGTTARRLMRASLSMTGGALNSMADGDELWFRLGRLGGATADTLTGDAFLKKILLSWAST